MPEVEALDDKIEEAVMDGQIADEVLEGGEGEAAKTPADGDLAGIITEKDNEISELQDKILRMAAEFENYKKRMVREKETFLKFAEEKILKELLPTIDNLERALVHENGTDDISNLREGVKLTLKGLVSTVNKFGLEAIESVGRPFDPNLHEALAMDASDELPAQSVLKEFEKGYQYKDRLLRAAKVVVSKGTSK